MDVDLQKVFKDKKKALTAWFTFADLFDIELEYTDRRGLEKMLNKSKKNRFDPKSHQKIEMYDDDLFNIGLASKVVNWKGLTLGIVEQLTNIDLAGDDPDTIVPCTEANKQALVFEIYGLNAFIRESMTDLALFRDGVQEDEKKISEDGQDS